MATLARKRIGNRDYYYLQHTVRRGAKVSKREVYLGHTPPRNVDELKRKLALAVFREQWWPRVEKIRLAYRRDARLTPKTAEAKAKETFAIRFTYDTQRIEGSTLTLRETADLLERGITPANRPIQDVKEAEAHKAVFDQAMRSPKDISRQTVLLWHHQLFKTTRPDIAGGFRRHSVRISGSRFVPPLAVEVEPLMREFFAWYTRAKDSLHPIERAALVHLKFVTIHPFGDGNGRISRLLMNVVLNRAGLPLFNISYEGRTAYYRALERSQTGGNDLPFLRWFVRKYVNDHRQPSK